MISLWKGENPIYFGVIRSKVKVTVTINRIFDNRIVLYRRAYFVFQHFLFFFEFVMSIASASSYFYLNVVVYS